MGMIASTPNADSSMCATSPRAFPNGAGHITGDDRRAEAFLRDAEAIQHVLLPRRVPPPWRPSPPEAPGTRRSRAPLERRLPAWSGCSGFPGCPTVSPTVMPGLIRGVSTCICSRISAAISSTRGRAKVCRIRAILGNGHRVSVIGASLLWGRTPHWGEKAPSRRVSFQRRFPNGGRGCTLYRKTNKNSVLY